MGAIPLYNNVNSYAIFWPVAVLRDSSPRDTNINSFMEEAVLREASLRDTNINSPMEEAVLRETSPRDTASVVTPTNAPDVNQMTEFDDGIEGNIGNCPCNFDSPLKIQQTRTIPMTKAEETEVPV